MRRIALALVLALLPGLALAQNVTSVGITNGVPTSGTGTVSTLDGLAGTAGSANSKVLSVQGIASGTAVKVDGSASTQPVSGTVTANIGTGGSLATAANQTTANSSLSTIATNSGSPIPDCGATPCTNKVGTIYLQSQIPAGATMIAGNTTGTTGAVTATLAGTSGKTTYICNLEVSAIGGTATIGPITVTGMAGGTATYYLASTASGNILPIKFDPCWPASATNTGIVTATTADGTATGVAVNTRGFQQ